MKKFYLSVLLFIGILAAVFQVSSVSSAAWRTDDYPLVCRGGGGLVIGIAPGEGNIGFSFTRGTRPAGEGLAPGECSWVDRGMYPNEPDRVSQHVEEGSESLKVGGTLAAENRWYEELHSANNYWTFMVSNNGRGQLIATSARPNNRKEVSSTVRVPSVIGQILKRDLPTARTPDDETPTVALSGQAEPPLRTETMKGLAGGRQFNVPLAARPMSMDERIEVLRLAGWKTSEEKLTPYVTLTPQQPYVADRGHVDFWSASTVDTGPFYGSGLATWDATGDSRGSSLWADLYFNAKGVYFIAFAVTDTSNPECLPKEECNMFSIELPDHSNHTFKAKGFKGKFMAPPFKLQYLTSIIHAETPGWYSLGLSYEARVAKRELWNFWSCDVTVLK